MTIILGTTKIKQSFYLLIPKNIAELIEIRDNTKFTLKVKNDGSKKILEYIVGIFDYDKKI